MAKVQVQPGTISVDTTTAANPARSRPAVVKGVATVSAAQSAVTHAPTAASGPSRAPEVPRASTALAGVSAAAKATSAAGNSVAKVPEQLEFAFVSAERVNPSPAGVEPASGSSGSSWSPRVDPGSEAAGEVSSGSLSSAPNSAASESAANGPQTGAALVPYTSGPTGLTSGTAKTTGWLEEEEEFLPEDVSLPRLAIVQRVGELALTFQPGSVVIDWQELLPPPSEPSAPGPFVRLFVVGFQPTVYVERVEGGGRGLVLRSVEEVQRMGGTVDWATAQERRIPLYQRQTTAVVCVEWPEKAEPQESCAVSSFPYEGRWYTLALYTMRATSYTHAARVWKTARRLGHKHSFWRFRVLLKRYDNNAVYVPFVVPAGPAPEDFRALLGSLLGIPL